VTSTSAHDATGTKITVAIDADPAHRAPVAWGADRAEQTGCDLELLFVIERSWGDEASAPSQTLIDAAQSHLAANRDFALGHLRHHAGTSLTTRWAYGSVAERLRAASVTADLIVVGVHSPRSGLGALIGSVGIRVAASASCSVVLVPHDWGDTGSGVVAGTDGSPESERAVEFAADEAQRHGEPLTVVCAGFSANPLLAGLVPEISIDHRRRRIVDAAKATVRDEFPSLGVDALVVEGPAAQALVDAAVGARLLVVGSRARHGAERMLLGSVGHDVAFNLGVPTALVRSRQ
jgi:Universal stress protein UspA and related nucleotide-binding proteins